MPNTHSTLGSLFEDIADQIRLKDGTVEAEDPIVADNFPTRISQISTDPSGDATATANDILAPKTAYSQGQKLTGTITTQNDSGNVTLDTTTTSKSYAAGYYPAAHGAELVKEMKEATPTENAQEITPTTGKVLSKVTVGAIDSNYVGSNIPRNDVDDLTVDGAVVSVPTGYYEESVSKSVATTTHPDPTVSTSFNSANNKLQITATHTQGTGYVEGSTTTAAMNVNGGTVTKSGKTVTTSAGYYNATVTTNVDTATQATPTMSATHDDVNNKLVVTATSTQLAGWVENGTKTATFDVADGTISKSGDTVTTGAGYYPTDVDTTIASGSATTPTSSITSNPTISFNSTSGKIEASHSGSKSITPTVSAGYVSAGTAGTVSTSGSASVTAESLDSDLTATNVKSGTKIFNTTGTFSASSTITGTGKTAAGAGNILTGKAAFLDGAQLNGTMANNGATGGTISTNGGTYTIPAGYTSGGTVTASIPGTTLTNSIIESCVMNPTTASGDEDTARVTVKIPAGTHSAVTVTKDFEDLLPGLDTGAANAQILDGYQAYDASGNKLTGTMTNNGAVTNTITTQNGEYTIPAGYHNGSGKVKATLGTTSRTAGAGSVTLTKGAGSVSATGTNITITEASSKPSSGYYITATGSGTVSGKGKGTVSTGTGYITEGSTTSNESSSASETSNTATKYYTVAGSSVTSGQNLPSGGTAAGTAGYGKYAKVSAGYYPSDRYIGSGVSAGSATTPATTVSPSVTSLSYAYDSTNTRFNVTGSGSTTTSVTPTVSAGYVSSGTAGTITGSASVSATVARVGTGVDITGTTTKQPSITRTAKPTTDTWVDAASGAATTTKPTSGPYVQVNTAANTGTLTATPKVTSAGYGNTTNYGSTAGTATVGASASANTYIPITTTSASVSGKTVSYGTGWITGGSKSVADGSATTPATSVEAGAGTGSVASSTGVVTISTAKATKSVTPTVSAGYVSSGTAGTITVPAKSYTYQLPTVKAATTYNTSTSDQTIAAGTYLTGAQTIKAVTTSGISAANIATGVTIKVGDANNAGRIANVAGTLIPGGNYTTFAIAGNETWTSDSSSGGVYHTFTVSGVTSSSNPVLDPVITSSSTASAINNAWSTVFKATTTTNAVTLYATDAITTAMTISVKGY